MWRVKITPTANHVRGIQYAVCLHNRTHKAGGACRRAFRGRPRFRHPIKSRRDFCIQRTHHAAERIKMERVRDKKWQDMRLPFLTNSKTPRKPEVFGVFCCNRCSRPARETDTRGDTVPSIQRTSPLNRKKPQAFSLYSYYFYLNLSAERQSSYFNAGTSRSTFGSTSRTRR